LASPSSLEIRSAMSLVAFFACRVAQDANTIRPSHQKGVPCGFKL
jgi:hypothetical protein